MALCSPHRVRSEDFHGGIAGRGFAMPVDLLTFFMAILLALFSLCIHLVVVAAQFVESSAQRAAPRSAVSEADTVRESAKLSAPQNAKIGDGPITWHTCDLASEVKWDLNPLALDMEPDTFFGLGFGDMGDLQDFEAVAARPPSPKLRSMWKPRLTVIIPEPAESFEVIEKRTTPINLSAPTPPFVPLTPSQLNARASSPALERASPLEPTTLQENEASCADLADTGRDALKNRPLIDPSQKPCVGKRPPGLRRGTVIFTAANSRPVGGSAPTGKTNEERSPSCAERVRARQAAAASKHVTLYRYRRAQA